MPKKPFMLGIILTSACTILLLYRCAWAGPSIRFEQTSFDFGTIIQGKSISHVFEFRNTGNEVLTIQSLRT